MLFELEFDYRCGQNWPVLDFSAYCSLTEIPISEFNKKVTIKTKIDDNQLVFKNINKNEFDTVVENGTVVRDQSVRLNRMWVDDILINFNTVQQYIKFVPIYRDSFLKYCLQNNITVDYNPYPLELFHNGQWSFSFKQPFWYWYADLIRDQTTKNFSKDEIELYLGVDTNSRLDSLIKLKELLVNV